MIERRRRSLLKGMICWPLFAGGRLALAQTRTLAFHHLHTDERIDLPYFADGSYLPDAISQMEHLLRDFRTNETHPIDLNLLDTLFALSERCAGGPFEVISGYRSAVTNAQLQATTEGVASNSFHLSGRAVDVRLSGCDTVKLRDAAVSLGRGGVGYYPRSDFVHLDTGRVRSWG